MLSDKSMKFAVLCLFLFACTIQVQTGKPEIQVACVLVELPGGEVRADCDSGSPDAGDDSSVSASSASATTIIEASDEAPQIYGGGTECPACFSTCPCPSGGKLQ